MAEVEDDGIGIPRDACEPRPGDQRGFGLVHVRERLEALGGRLEIREVDRGSRIEIRLPLRALGNIRREGATR